MPKIGETAITYGSVLMFVLFILAWFVLRETPIGRHVYAVGNNLEAARLNGINTDRLLLYAYTAAGLFYGIAGLLLIARTDVGDPQAGQAQKESGVILVDSVRQNVCLDCSYR